MIDKYLPRAVEMHRKRFPDLERTEQEIVDYLSPKLERFLEHFGHLSAEELQKKTSVVQYDAYDLGFLVSADYTNEELEAKKRYYLSLVPSEQSGKSIERWQFEVERQFKRKDLQSCPDKVFLYLDTYREKGYV